MTTSSDLYLYETAKRLDGSVKSATIPLSRPRSKVYSEKRRVFSFHLSHCAEVEVLLSAIAVALFRYNGCERVTIGSADVCDTKLSVALVSVGLEPTTTVNAICDDVKRQLESNPKLSVSDLRQLTGIVGRDNESMNPLFSVALAQAEVVEALIALKTDIVLTESEGNLIVNSNDRLYSPKRIESFVSDLTKIFSQITAFRNEVAKNLTVVGKTTACLPKALVIAAQGGSFQTVISLVAAKAATVADSPAIICGENIVTYSEIEARSALVAGAIVQRGAAVGANVGVCLKPGVDQLVAMLAVLKTGATIVPIDYTLPPARIKEVTSSTRMVFAVTNSDFEHLISDSGVTGLDYASLLAGDFAFRDDAVVRPDTIAYILFTSGSSGRPKGVRMPHRGLANVVRWQLSRSQPDAAARTLQRTSLAFDVGFQEIFSTWGAGGCLVVASESERAEVDLLPELIRSNGITRLFLPPVALRQLAQLYDSRRHRLETIREINVAGEQLKIDRSIVQFARDTGLVLENQYGPTETHVVTAFRLGLLPLRWPTLPPIGREVDNTVVSVLDPWGDPAADGAVGEIWITGESVAAGYLDIAETARCFPPSPLDPSTRAYRTGDFGWRDDAGDLHYVGRADEQVKIRGYRVELGELESALADIPGVTASAAKAIRSETGDLALVAYFSSATLDADAAWSRLGRSLPPYAIPGRKFVVRMESLPLTATGKIDKTRLPLPLAQSQLGGGLPDERNTKEKVVAGILAQELDIDAGQIGESDTFVDLGGDSLHAIQVILAFERYFGATIPLRSIMRGTVGSLASELSRLQHDERSELSGIQPDVVSCSVTLPDGSRVDGTCKAELEYLVRDVFTFDTYFRNGAVLPPDSVIVDVGAHVGLFSLRAGQLTSHARLIAVEPSAELFACLQKNLADSPHRVDFVACAAGASSGNASYTFYPNMPGMSSLRTNPTEDQRLLEAILREQENFSSVLAQRDGSFFRELIDGKLQRKTYSVAVRPLSDILTELSVERIDLLKIDTQRSELDVLRGIRSPHWENIQQIFVEAHNLNGDADLIFELLVHHGFEVDVCPHPLHTASVVRMLYAKRRPV